MEWHFNDLSLAGQYENESSVKVAINEILNLRQRRKDLATRLYCSRELGGRPATSAQTLQQVVMGSSDKDFRSRTLRWIASAGPFWTDSRAENPEDLFYFDEDDVTNQGLGEAIRRQLFDVETEAFSLASVSERFKAPSLRIVQGLLEGPIGEYELDNCRGCEELETRRTLEISGWESMLETAATFRNLHLGPRLIDDLRPKPFQRSLAERILLLLDILNRLSGETDLSGALSEKGQNLFQQFFVGKNSWFSPEEKSDLLKFEDPGGGSKKIDCSWHGKTKLGGQTRVHFEWPRPVQQERIKVAYIGTKLTKW